MIGEEDTQVVGGNGQDLVAPDAIARVAGQLPGDVPDRHALPELDAVPPRTVLLVRNEQDRTDAERLAGSSPTIVEVPDVTLDRFGQVKLAAIVAVSTRTIDLGDTVVFLTGPFRSLIDSVVVMTIGAEYELFDAQEFIDFAVDGAKRMQALIHDLLQYARVGTRGKQFKPTPANRVVEDALANLAGAIEESGAEIRVEALPTISCDSTQLTQVFQNLIGNALKFRRKDSKPIVQISARLDPIGWRFTVADNGIGIEPKYFERIFQMFQRLHGREQYEGTGIGLALCKKIVERHGGQITVASELGHGTTFSFVLPDASARAARAS